MVPLFRRQVEKRDEEEEEEEDICIPPLSKVETRLFQRYPVNGLFQNSKLVLDHLLEGQSRG